MFLSIATSNMVATALAKQVGNKCVRLLDVESDACVVTQN